MATRASRGSKVWIDHYDMSGFLNAAEFAFERELIDRQTFATTGPSVELGNYTHRGSAVTLFDGATAQSDDILHALFDTSNHYRAIAPGAGTLGSVVVEQVVTAARKPHRGANGQIITMADEWVGAGEVSQGHVLANTTATATGVYTGVQQTELTTASKYQSVVRALTGSSFSITVDIESSSDNVTFTTMPGMTATLTQAARVSRITSTGGSKAYKRARVSARSGSATAVALVVTGGLVY